MVRRSLAAALAFAALTGLLASAALATDAAPATGKDVVLAGLYSDQWEAGRDLEGLGVASGKRLSLMGTFHHLLESETGWAGTTDWLLEQAWSVETTPMANVYLTVTAGEVAAGFQDAEITRWALRVKGWLDRGRGRSLLIAPMQEMNGDWVPYGMDPVGYRTAFRRFVEVFRALGMDETKVRWVFAPNGWSVAPYRIADYYPGDDLVDLIGVSAFNFGDSGLGWGGVPELIASALSELRSFAPYKPYLISQVGSSTSGGDRDAWLREMFDLAATDPNVVGLIYFNFIKESDWKIWDGVNLAAGWRDGMQMASTVHRWPLGDWFRTGPMPFAPYQGTFADDDAIPHQADIEWLVDRGITQGCADRRFCPNQAVTRGEVATFLARVLELPPATADHFVDDDGSAHEADINALAAAGIAQGCGVDRFCPGLFVSRQELAGMLAQALELPPSPTLGFADVAGSPYEPYISSLVAAGIAQGCGPGQFCPWGAVNRDQMAVLLHRSAELRSLVSDLPLPARVWLHSRYRPI
jgi:hypothetical protein